MRFIQVGVGGFGHNWLNCLKNEKRAKVVGLVDISDAALDNACKTLGCARAMCYSSFDKALSQVHAHACICATPPAHHREHVIAALKAGLHVISEKPMAESPADCAAMVRAAARTAKTYAVSQNYRFRPALYAMAHSIRKGLIGDIGQVRIDFFKGRDFGGGFRHVVAYPVLVDISIHHFDLLRFLTGMNALTVTGRAWNPPWSNYKGDCSSAIVFEMENGAHALYNASWCAKGDYCDWNGNWFIEGTRGCLAYANGCITYHKTDALYTVKKTVEITPREMKKTDQEFVLDNFITAIKKDVRPLTDCTDNIHSIRMVFAAVQAVKSGKKVRISNRHKGE